MKLGDFEALKVIGSGSGGVVYQARSARLDRVVALKQIQRLPGQDGQRAAERILAEARLMAQVRSDHVVVVYADHTIDGLPVIEMEYMEGGSLEAMLAERDLSVQEATDVLEQVLSGLTAIHALGLIHRDVKPGNVLSDGKGRFKISDFGISVAVGGHRTLPKGTAQYMAPEVVMPPHAFDYRADLYSVGILAYESFVGRSRFRGLFGRLFEGGEVAADHKWVNWTCDPEVATPLHELRPDVSTRVSDVVARLMHKDPAQRFSSALEALTALRPTVARTEEPLGAGPRPQTPQTSPPPRGPGNIPRRWKYVAASFSVILVFGILGLRRLRAPMDVSVDTSPSGATVLFDGREQTTPAQLQQLDPAKAYELAFRKPGFEERRVSFAPSWREPVVVYKLTPDCGKSGGLGISVRVRLEGFDPSMERRMTKQLDFARVVGPDCEADGIVNAGPPIAIADGASLADPIHSTGDAALAEAEQRLQSLYVRRVLLGPKATSAAAVQVKVSRGDTLAAAQTGNMDPVDAQSLRVGVDKMAYWVRPSAFDRLLVLDISSRGDLFVVYPSRFRPGNRVVPGAWTRIPQEGLPPIPVDPPTGKETVVAIAFKDGAAVAGLDEAYPALWNGPTGPHPFLKFEGSEARRFAETVAQRLVDGGWTRAAESFQVAP